MFNTASQRSKSKRIVALSVVASMLATSWMPAYAVSTATPGYAGVVSQAPGYYNAPPDVNVMFTLDDSGSMQWETIPDSSEGVDTDMWVDTWQCLDWEWWGCRRSRGEHLIDKFKLSSTKWRYYRSPQGNPLFYNPGVRYEPWPYAGDDTKRYANADPAAACYVFQKLPISTAKPQPATPPAISCSNTWDLKTRVNVSGGSGAADGENNNFWPATYFQLKAGATVIPNGWSAQSDNIDANWQKIEIKPGVASYPKGAQRTDCAGTTTCTYQEEIQNFANWFQYYRNRALMAKGGIAAAFAKQGTNMRVGFAAINDSNVVRRGVRTFTGDARRNFYLELYDRGSSGGTPLRLAMDKVGAYFERTDGGNPWSEDPSNTSAVGTEHACRRSFHILSTDGFWNGSGASSNASKNNDTFSGNTPAKPDGTDYEYSNTLTSTSDDLVARFTIDPFRDKASSPYSGTLADVAAYYWKRDLRSNLANIVVPSPRDPAFWQHLTTFTVGLGITGSGSVTDANGNPVDLSTDAARKALIDNKTELIWPQVSADSAQTGDDLIHASMNGRGRYFSATNPTDLATGLADALAEVADQPLDQASVAADAPQVQAGGRVYQATFSPARWYGRLYAFDQNATTGRVNNKPSRTGDINPTQVWEASLALPAPADRNIYTSRGGAATGHLFTWAGLSSTQQTDLGGDPNVLKFLRGDDSLEASNGGSFRNRSRYTLNGVTGGTLGDIVNGSPVKGPDAGAGYDRLGAHAAAERSSYQTFRLGTQLDDMRHTIFFNANDGMAHAIDMANGRERFAYVPASVYNVPRSTAIGGAEQKLKMLSDLSYTHRFTVDGPPNVADAYVNGNWRTLLISSTGAGSRGVFALDVTNPTVGGTTGFDTSKVMWEFSEADNKDMGFVLGYPHVARMRNGTWAAIFGNGYDSVNGKAKLFIVDVATGTVLKEFEVGTAGNNGLSQPNFILNAEREVTHIYAGDLQGNLWKFDVDSTDPNQWGPAFGATSPLFRTQVTGGVAQPITVMPEITVHPNGGQMITFGTGKLFENSDTAQGSTNVNLNRQSIYSVWDKPGETTGITGSRTVVLAQHTAPNIVTPQTFGSTTGAAPDWNSQRGWFIDLDTGGERVNLAPQQIKNVLFVVANTPKTADPCANGGSSKIFALNPVTGERLSFRVFDVNGDGTVDINDSFDNVRVNHNGLLTQPIFQVAASAGTTVIPTIAVSPYAVFDRGQSSAARAGGVELSRSFGGTVNKKWDCNMLMTAAQSDTSLQSLLAQVCPPDPGKARISWRQLK